VPGIGSQIQDGIDAMGPVIASIHAKRDEYREQLERDGGLNEKPKLRTSPRSTAG
jgi:CPA2 family monovalent cation:H+ antiporter-2